MKLEKQHGFTLVEMLVALMIAGIFFSVFAAVVLATFETLRTGDERTVAQQNARVCINYIANDILHATEIAPLRIEAYRDWATGGFPYNEDTWDPFDDELAWPIYRRSVDGSDKGFIDLDYDDGEYEYFRGDDDPLPYDVRALAPNRISLLFYGSAYYPNTEYWSGFMLPIDLDNSGFSTANPTAAVTRITYEHQLIKPLHPEIYRDSFSGREKLFSMVVNRTNASTIQDTIDFVVTRSFEMRNPTVSHGNWIVGETADDPLGDLGLVDDQIRVDEYLLRQPVADHVMNLRFRYWHIGGDKMMEIRYDPDMSHIEPGGGVEPDDGYYRYFDIHGNEIYVWYHHDEAEMVPLLPTDYTEAEWLAIDPYSFIIHGGDDGTDEYERGLLLFEGWRGVNAVSITVKTANNRTLQLFRSSINQAVTSPVGAFYEEMHPDYGMGFVDFGLDGQFEYPEWTLNAYQPLYQGADNVRTSFSLIPGDPRPDNLFDFVEPNMNPNYNPNTFTTLQTLVVPPVLVEKAKAAIQELTWAYHYKSPTG